VSSALNLEERILYRDGLILVIDKPEGIPVHAGPKGGPNLEDGFDDLRFGLPNKPQLAHRLDRDTSGCLVLGRHRKALSRLGKMFASSRVQKTYTAIIPTVIEGDSGVIDAPLIKVHKYKGWKMRVAGDGEDGAQESVSEYRVLARGDGCCLVEFYPKTGRTHQLRVHALHAFGVPILGDTLYGDADAGREPRLYLHASRIVLPLYPNKEAVDVAAPLPDKFRAHPVCSGM